MDPVGESSALMSSHPNGRDRQNEVVVCTRMRYLQIVTMTDKKISRVMFYYDRYVCKRRLVSITNC